MSYINNATGDPIALKLIAALPQYEKSESTSRLLNGAWVCQSIGAKAKKLEVRGICSYTALMELTGYADTKEMLTISFLGSLDKGFIIDKPIYDVIIPGVEPTCDVTFEMAVIPNV